MDDAAFRELLDTQRRATLSRVRELTLDFDEIVSGAVDSNIDDEHDPEGATVAFERARVAALLSSARADLDELDQALRRLVDGTYRVCARCRSDISDERLAAMPAARTCVGCAGSGGLRPAVRR